MSSLYNITDDLLQLFADIEDNDGEITDEQFAQLQISKEDLKIKLDNYYKAIKIWDNEVKACKDEVKRINDFAKVKLNRVERLKKSMLTAVEMFGDVGKTNKFIELSTCRLFTRGTDAVDVDEPRIAVFISQFSRYVQELELAGVLYTGKDVDLVGVLDAINANIIAEMGESFEPFTMTDITSMRLNISTTMSLSEMFRDNGEVFKVWVNNPDTTKVTNNTMKADWKTAIEVSKESETSPVTVAKVVKNTSLQIK